MYVGDLIETEDGRLHLSKTCELAEGSKHVSLSMAALGNKSEFVGRSCRVCLVPLVEHREKQAKGLAQALVHDWESGLINPPDVASYVAEVLVNLLASEGASLPTILQAMFFAGYWMGKKGVEDVPYRME